MNVDQYLKNQSDLIETVLRGRPSARDWRTFSAGVFCLTGAMALEVWIAQSLVDPGYFARASTFLSFVLLAGVWLLTAALIAEVLIARIAIPSHSAVVEQTLGQLIKMNGSIVHKTSRQVIQ